jgi:hypothetical protein
MQNANILCLAIALSALSPQPCSLTSFDNKSKYRELLNPLQTHTEVYMWRERTVHSNEEKTMSVDVVENPTARAT